MSKNIQQFFLKAILQIISVIILLALIFVCWFYFFQDVFEQRAKASVNDNVSGWAWSENIGWISFNCTDTGSCSQSNYGVNVNQQGNFSGYAWSENIGWIRFDPPGPYPGQPNNSARFNLGNNEVSGWARACAGAEDPTNCSGGANPTAGGWDGWIKLRKHPSDGSNVPDYGVYYVPQTNDLHGWAWGSNVVGWISFNCAEGGANGGNICGQSNYKVSANINQPPNAQIQCDPGNCTVYNTETLTFRNNSTDPNNNITQSRWDILNFGSSPEVTCPPGPVLCDYTVSNMSPGTYTIELRVQDAGGLSDTDTRNFTIKQDAVAGFMCSLDNSTWVACETLTGQVSQGEVVYFKDSTILPEHSVPSQGAKSITSRLWKINDTVFSSGNNTNPSTTLSASTNSISLTIQDDNGRSATKSHSISTQLPFPGWQEISPF